jgi:hypothetical protein
MNFLNQFSERTFQQNRGRNDPSAANPQGECA